MNGRKVIIAVLCKVQVVLDKRRTQHLSQILPKSSNFWVVETIWEETWIPLLRPQYKRNLEVPIPYPFCEKKGARN